MNKPLAIDVAREMWIRNAVCASDDLSFTRADGLAQWNDLDCDTQVRHVVAAADWLDVIASVMLIGGGK